jgi:hypothetical protein
MASITSFRQAADTHWGPALTRAVAAGKRIEHDDMNEPLHVSGPLTLAVPAGKAFNPENMRLRFTGVFEGQTALRVIMPNANPICFEKVTIETEEASGGQGLQIEMGARATLQNRSRDGAHFDGLNIGPSASTGSGNPSVPATGVGFKRQMTLTGINNVSFASSSLVGTKAENGQWVDGSCGLEVKSHATVDVTLTDISGLQVTRVETGVMAGQMIEGLFLTNSTQIVGVGFGVVCDWDSGTSPINPNPALNIMGSHINARYACVKMNNAYDVTVIGALLYRFVHVAGDDPWYAFDLESVFRGSIANCQIVGNPSAGKSSQSYAGKLSAACRDFAVSNNVGYGLDGSFDVSSVGAQSLTYRHPRIYDNLLMNDSMVSLPGGFGGLNWQESS